MNSQRFESRGRETSRIITSHLFPSPFSPYVWTDQRHPAGLHWTQISRLTTIDPFLLQHQLASVELQEKRANLKVPHVEASRTLRALSWPRALDGTNTLYQWRLNKMLLVPPFETVRAFLASATQGLHLKIVPGISYSVFLNFPIVQLLRQRNFL